MKETGKNQEVTSERSGSPLARRDFAKVLAGSVIGLSLAGTAAAAETVVSIPAPKRNNLIHVGGDYHVVLGGHWTSKLNMEYHQRMGIKHFTNLMNAGNWDLGEMKKWKAECDKYNMIWEAIRMDSSYIAIAPGPARDKKIAEIIEDIKKASEVGVKVITMHWTMIPIRRNGHAPGRGGSSYESFKLEDNWKELPATKNGPLSYDDYWERITFFLENVIPVCEKYDVRLGVHPYDPPGLPRGYQGVDNWNGAPAGIFESLKKYESIVDSPYNGLQLCLGTVMEGLKNPRTDLLPIVKYFAKKGKIHQIHMRNIKGGLGDFQEVYIDEGESDFIEVIRVLRDSGFGYSVCPDHVPTHPDDPRRAFGFAHAFGYIQAMIDSANSEVRA